MFFRGTSSLLALLALSTPVFADVTPAEVWQNWIDYYKVNGYTVTEGNRDEAGDTLTLTDVAITRDFPDGTLNMMVPRVQLQATGDGNVRTTADAMTADLDTTDSDGENFALKMSATMPGAEIISSGTPDDMMHDATAPTIMFKVDEVKNDDQTMTDVVTLNTAGTVFSQKVATGDKTRMEYSGSSGQTDVVIKASGKDEDGRDSTVDGTLSIASIKGSGEATLPNGVNMDDMPAALRAGLSFAGTGTVGQLTGKFDVVETEDDGTSEPANMSFTSDGFSLDGALSADGMNYQIDSDGLAVEIASAGMPFPVKYSTESGTATLQLPVSKTDTPMPFKLAYSFSGLTLGDELWNNFDPNNKLPREPASLELDVTGTTRLAKDLFDPENMKSHGDNASEVGDEADVQDDAAAADSAGTATDETADNKDMSAEEDQMPFQPTEITLNQFLIDAVGAKLSASGTLTAPDGGDINAPVGMISARYEGVNGLIDKLIDMGVVSKEDVTGYRMMLALFSKPAPGEDDVLTTELEFKEGGSIFANGQQVK